MIKIEHLVKSFEDVKAVNDISLEIKPGEIVGLLGPNGAGKTTTLRLITGFLTPDSGKVVINGADMVEEPTKAQKHIGYLPENNPLYKDMLVADFLSFSADLKQIPAKEKKAAFDFAVSAVAIEDVYYKPIRELSKGFKQRVGIAATLLHKPKIIILDEPTEGLDPNQRTEIRELIKQLSKNHTIVMSTHVLAEAAAVCNRILIINRGALVADGAPNDLTKKDQESRTLRLEVEGANVKESLKSMEGVLESSFTQERGGKIKASLVSAKTIQLQPAISELARKHHWIIWQLSEEETKLEQVFQELTQ